MCAQRTPSAQQVQWLKHGLDQPGGKLPLFDEMGQKVSPRTVQACIDAGWAERWFDNPLKKNWLVCRLTASGRTMLENYHVVWVDFRRVRDTAKPE